MIEICFFLLVMIAVWFTFVNLGMALHGQNVPMLNFFLQSSAIAGIITLYYFDYI